MKRTTTPGWFARLERENASEAFDKYMKRMRKAFPLKAEFLFVEEWETYFNSISNCSAFREVAKEWRAMDENHRAVAVCQIEESLKQIDPDFLWKLEKGGV